MKKPVSPKPRQGQSLLLTRAEARRRAVRHVMNRIFGGAAVLDGAKAKTSIYQRGWSVQDAWVVYKNPEAIGLRSSEVVLVCKRTGRVLCEGSACDEG